MATKKIQETLRGTRSGEPARYPTEKLTLTVREFSCIKKADIQVNRLTVLIGPQASGKSLLSKLIYFFNSIFSQHLTSEAITDDIESFKKIIRAQFTEWFPIAAWGNGKFRIEYKQGQYQLKLMRSIYGGKVGDTIKISVSQFVEELHSARSQAYKAYTSQARGPEFYDGPYRVHEQLRLYAGKRLRGAFVSAQVFIPAGRSFFTSMGKAVTAFEHARLLDPITIAFGKRLTNLRDRGGFSSVARNRQTLLDRAAPLLGGKVVFGPQGDFIETPDGRKVPFNSLSSGQQELLPLLLTLSPLESGMPTIPGRRFICVEEPEAHLFPTAQSIIVEYLAGFTKTRRPNDLFITTHSPYVLSKINNLIFAGSISLKANDKVKSTLAKIVSPQLWLWPSEVSAYAVREGIVVSVQEEDGLVAGDYLDDVSGSIAREFNELLELE